MSPEFPASPESILLQPQFVAPAPPPPLPRPTPVAHATHTAALLLILLLTTLYGHLHTAPAIMQVTPHMTRFVSSILYEWLLLGSVIAGIYHRDVFLSAALLRRIPSLAVSFAQGLGIYVMGLVAVLGVSALLYFTPLRGMRNQGVLDALLPHTPAQFAVWFLVSLSAGVCEELIFRGYLLQQFTAWTSRPILSVLLAGLVFGSIHLYEGLGAILPIAALGIVYGLCVHYFRGDLRAVIVAHTLQDFLTALFALARTHTTHNAQQVHAVLGAWPHTLAQNIFSCSAFFS